MKKAVHLAGKNVAWREVRVGVALALTMVLVACGGGSGGSDDTAGPNLPPPGEPGTTYAVSGSINGLIGPIQLSDGHQTLDVTAAGTFAFEHRYQRGETFSVSVNTGSTDQLCTVTHGAGLVLKDIDDVSVDCLELRQANVIVSKPSIYTSFDRLALRSSYQYLSSLSGESSNLVVAKSQFVTLYTNATPAVPVYLAFVKSFDGIRVDSLSTAVALVMLNPSIHNAIEERAAKFDSYAERFAALDAVVALAANIKTRADAGRLNLQAPAADFLPLLDAAVTAAANDVKGNTNVVATSPVASGARSQKLHITPPAGDLGGVSLVLQKLASADVSGNDHELQISNRQQRHIAIESLSLPAPLALAPDSVQSQLLKLTGITSTSWTVYGAGAQAASAPVSPLLKQAVIDTASQFYAYPTLSFELGRLNRFDLRMLLCIDAETLQQLRETANATLLSSAALDKALRTPHYTAAYDETTALLRSGILANLPDLMACEFFRQGRWLDDHIETASQQLSTVLNVAQAHYAPATTRANVLLTPALLAAGDVINSSMTTQQWQLSNQLSIVVRQIRNGITSPLTGTATINEGETLALDASCIEPESSQPVDCALQWNSTDGSTVASAQFNQPFNDSGNFSITVSATDSDGATASRTVGVSVTELAPLPRLRNAAGTLMTAGSVFEFAPAIPVGAVVEATFTLRNEGTDLLNVGNIGVNGSAFSLVSASDDILTPGESSQIVLRFSPLAAGTVSAAVAIALSGNEPQDAQTLQFTLRGTGTDDGEIPLRNSYWLQQDGNTTQQYNVRSADIVDAVDGVRQFRGFLSSTARYPQINVSLPDAGDSEATYSLDDIDSGRACLGFIAYAQAPAQWWCTKTTNPFSTAPASGSATYSVNPQGLRTLVFDFQVVPAECAGPPCAQQRVTGRFEIP